MEQIKPLSDNRLIQGCVYCGGLADTRDHVPSKCLLEPDPEYPTNLPVVGCCNSCNQSFSRDEQYVVCLIESVLCGSSDPEKIPRPSVSKIMRKTPSLRARIESSKTLVDGQVAFTPEAARIDNVMLKLARGHAAYELSKPCRTDPDGFWCRPVSLIPENELFDFNSPEQPQIFGEVGSRNMQRFSLMSLDMIDGSRESFLMNSWIEVQKNLYRYQAIHGIDGIVIRIVISEYIACQAVWIEK